MLPLPICVHNAKTHTDTPTHTRKLPKHFQNHAVQTLYCRNIHIIDIMILYALSIFSGRCLMWDNVLSFIWLVYQCHFYTTHVPQVLTILGAEFVICHPIVYGPYYILGKNSLFQKTWILVPICPLLPRKKENVNFSTNLHFKIFVTILTCW